MAIREGDPMEQAQMFDHERRFGSLEKDVTVLQNNQLDLKLCIKDITNNQQEHALVLTEIKTGVNFVSKAITFGIPILITIVSAYWSYYTFIQDHKAPQEIIQGK